MKLLLTLGCCSATVVVGDFLLDQETIWAGLAGGLVLPLIMAYPAWLVINWLIPKGEAI